MAITKTVTEDKIEVVNGGHAIQIRNKVVIKEDDAVISSSYNRRVIHPCVKQETLGLIITHQVKVIQ